MTDRLEELREILAVIKEGDNYASVHINIDLGGGSGSADPDDPPDPGVITHTIKPRPNGSVPVYRTPTTEDKNKLQLTLIGDQKVIEKTPPKKIHRSPVWSTDQDLYNVQANWAWLPRQMVVKNNNKAVMLPVDFIPEDDTEIIWQGCFIRREHLR